MSAARGVLAVVALAVLTACPNEPDCFGTGTGLPSEQPPKLAVVGQQVDVSVTASAPFACDGPGQFPDSLTAEVYSPDNRLVPSTTVLRGSSAGGVRFTPDMPGRYHVLAAFAPVGGIRQVGVVAAVDRTGEAPVMALPEHCNQLERTARGTLLCGAAVVRDGQVVQRLGASGLVPRMVAVAGDVVWAADASNVYRYVDTGGALVLSGSTGHTDQQPEFLLATEDELLVLHTTTLRRYVSSAGVPTATGASAWNEVQAVPLAPDQPRGFLVRSGDVLAVVGRGTVGQGGGFTAGTRVCTYHLQDGRYVRALVLPCQELPGSPEGIEDGVLWVRETGSPTPPSFLPDDTVRRYVLTHGRFEEQGSLRLGPTTFVITPLFRSTSAPVFGLGAVTSELVVPTWRPEQGDVVLEILDRTLFSASASSRFFWGMGPAGPRARERPLPP